MLPAHAEKAIDAFAKTYGAKWPKAVAKIAADWEELLAFYDFPPDHWIHLRATNPIESTGAHLVALVRSGARYESGALVEREQLDAA